MPRYFFNVYHSRPNLDSVGEELPDVQAAWKEATTIAGQMIQGMDGKLQPGQGWRMEVTDESAKLIYAIRVCAKLFR
jgi:hypothetical protein